MSKSFTVAEVAKHKDEKDGGMYIIVDDGVYDISSECWRNRVLAPLSRAGC